MIHHYQQNHSVDKQQRSFCHPGSLEVEATMSTTVLLHLQKRDFKLSPNVGYFVPNWTIYNPHCNRSCRRWLCLRRTKQVGTPLIFHSSHRSNPKPASQLSLWPSCWLSVRDRWSWSMANGGWDAHMCGLEFNNHLVEAGRGYLLRAVNSETGEQMQVKVPGLPK